MLNPQLNRHKGLTHLLCTEGLPKALLLQILDRAQTYLDRLTAGLGGTDPYSGASLLAVGIEAESALQLALTEATHFLGIACGAFPGSLPRDGQGWQQALNELSDIECDLLVVQHPVSGTPYFLAQHLPAERHVMNAGDGCHAKPIEALVDLFLIRERRPDLNALIAVFAGSLQESGFARSLVHAMTTVGVPEVRAIVLAGEAPEGIERMGVLVCEDARRAKADADLVIDLERDQITWQAVAQTEPSDKHKVRVAVCASICSLILEAR